MVVVGAPRFDEFFTLRPQLARHAFFAPLGLDPSRLTLLYVCSSRFIAERELPFVRQWLAAVRSGPEPLRGVNVIVRPHPDVVLDEESATETVAWDGMPRATGWVQRPFDDPGAVVLRTTYATPQAFFECLHHAAAVVGLNTSAELEAGIAGRPVLTLLSREAGADGQANTLHFNYLLREHGGFVACAQTMAEHIEALAGTVADPPDPAAIRRFIGAFLRPQRRAAGLTVAGAHARRSSDRRHAGRRERARRVGGRRRHSCGARQAPVRAYGRRGCPGSRDAGDAPVEA